MANIPYPHLTIIDEGVQMAEDVTVHPFTQLRGIIEIGARTIIGSHVNIFAFHGKVTIGEDTRCQSYSIIPHDTRIGSRVFMAAGCIVCNDKRPPSPDWFPVTIEDDVSIGAGVLIMPGLVLGKGCRVDAGAVVTRDVPPGGHVRGVPARLQRLQEYLLTEDGTPLD